jgi:hypothetical protein
MSFFFHFKRAKKYKKNILFLILFIFLSSFFYFQIVRAAYISNLDAKGNRVFKEFNPKTDSYADLGPKTKMYSQVAGLDGKILTKELGTEKILWDQMWQDWKTNYAIPTGDRLLNQTLKAGLSNTFRTALLTLAQKSAVQLATEREGQTPIWHKEEWGDFLQGIGDQAIGQIISEASRGFGAFNVCSPNLDVKMKILLPLINTYQKPPTPDCSWTTMKKNWESEFDKFQDMKTTDYLKKLQSMFKPTSNDLGIALVLETGIAQKIEDDLKIATFNRKESDGNLLFNLFGKRVDLKARLDYKAVKDLKIGDGLIQKTVGDPLIDAINVFTNTYAGTWLEQQMNKLIEESYEDSKTEGSSVDFTNPLSASRSNISKAREVFRGISELKKTKIDKYDIKSKLVMCPDNMAIGTTDCVISQDFMNLLLDEDGTTLAKAIEDDKLSGGIYFGFAGSNHYENSVSDLSSAIPYRSMPILRKYRIIPVGWELAAQYIKENKLTCTIQDLVSCFDPNDDHTTTINTEDCFQTNREWCEGLVDPNWVLKIPASSCGQKGVGNKVLSREIIGSGLDNNIVLQRDEEYCADDKSCILEDDRGNCQAFGYCSQERRKWQFDMDTCEPVYNTCQNFSDEEGVVYSFLENTLERCLESGAGCASYCRYGSDGDCIDEDQKIEESNYNNVFYFNNKVKTCDNSQEGCRALLRTEPGTHMNLLSNGNFELASGTTNWSEMGTIENDPETDNRYLVLDKSSGDIDNNHIDITQIGDVVSIDIELDFTPNHDSSDFILGGQYFSLHFDSMDCDTGAFYGLENAQYDFSNPVSSEWQSNDLIYLYEEDFLGSVVKINLKRDTSDKDCKIDNISLVRGNTEEIYQEEERMVYQKLAPDYLECNGSDEDPIECFGFIHECSPEDVGCSRYTSKLDDVSITAVGSEWDTCPESCVGYDTYIQGETLFNSLSFQNIIPNNSTQCHPNEVGCSQFTNLDKTENQGEAKENYTYLRRCIKVDDNECEAYYSWEGSDEAGYQLKSYLLKKGDDNGPYVYGNEYNNLYCNASTYGRPDNPFCQEFYDKDANKTYRFINLTVSCSDDCYPFRKNKTNIISRAQCNSECSDLYDRSLCNCNNSCTELDSNGKNSCSIDGDHSAFCKSGGQWSVEQQACIYFAIPDESIACQENNVGCYKYTGNAGSDLMILDRIFDFRDNSLDQFSFKPEETGFLSEEGIIVSGDRSLKLEKANEQIIFSLDDEIENGEYVLSFIARVDDNPVILGAKFKDAGEEDSRYNNFFNDNVEIKNKGSWQDYEIYGSIYDATSTTQFIIEKSTSTDGILYIDNIMISKRLDHYYLIQDSSNIPEECDKDFDSNISIGFHLGCDSYTDQRANTHFFRQFSRSCDDENIGCELMIDTHNLTNTFQHTDDAMQKYPKSNHQYGAVYHLECKGVICNDSVGCDCYEDGEKKCHINYLENKCFYDLENIFSRKEVDEVFEKSNSKSKIKVYPQEFIYAIYDRHKSCDIDNKGCEKFGDIYSYGQLNLIKSDLYLVNDPDLYNVKDDRSILCHEDYVGCKKWNIDDGEGSIYFKDPGDMVCELRNSRDEYEMDYSWYQKSIRRCDEDHDGEIGSGEDKICLQTSDCFDKNVTIESCTISDNCNGKTQGHACLDIDELDYEIVDKIKYRDISRICACQSDDDCGENYTCFENQCQVSCITETKDIKCATDDGNPKTIGYGGPGNVVRQPVGYYVAGNKWAGYCSQSQSGCTEFIDPRSDFSTNMINNSDFSLRVDNEVKDWDDRKQNIKLDFNTLYVLSIERLGNFSNGASISLVCESKDHVDSILEASNLLKKLSNDDATNIDLKLKVGQKRNSISFLSKEANITDGCYVEVSHNGENEIKVGLRKAIIDYRIIRDKEDLSSGDCNYKVDFNEGCVLFNIRDMGDDISSNLYKSLDRDVDLSPDVNFTWHACGADDVNCSADANYLLKVRPDRVCNQWLACKSYVEDRNGDVVCFDIGLCDKIENGICSNFLLPAHNDEVYYYKDDLDNTQIDISNLSGYSKVTYNAGIGKSLSDGTKNKIPASMYHLSDMRQEGGIATIENGNFEIYDSYGKPLGWQYIKGVNTEKWSSNHFFVIKSSHAPLTSAKNICFSYSQNPGNGNNCDFPNPEGDAFLRLDASYNVVSDAFDLVNSENEFFLTFYINTLNFQGKKVSVSVLNNNLERISGDSRSFIGAGQNWQLGFIGIDPSRVTGQVRVKIEAVKEDGEIDNEATGDIYIDDIKLTPHLKINDQPWYIRPICRLYPKKDALSCDYYEESGLRQKGWLGYCLEYDQHPGSEDNCILWYPIDKAKGDEFLDADDSEVSLGYYPLYYCAEMLGVKILEHRTIYDKGKFSRSDYCGPRANCPDNYNPVMYGCDQISGESDDGWCACYPKDDSDHILYLSDGHQTTHSDRGHNCHCDEYCGNMGTNKNDGWYEFDGDFELHEKGKGIKFYDPISKTVTDYLGCATVVQVITPTNKNQAWFKRAKSGSEYRINLSYSIDIIYDDLNIPFGAMAPPSPVDTPEEWDGVVNTDYNKLKQIIPFTIDFSSANAGIAYGCYEDDLGLNDYSNCRNYGLCSETHRLCYLDASLKDQTFTDEDLNKYPELSNIKYLQCPSGETCQEVGYQDNFFKDRFKNLFAQSYRAWEWSSVSTCSGGENHGQACEKGHFCEGGSCESPGYNICVDSYNNGNKCTKATCDDEEVCLAVKKEEEGQFKCGGTGSELCCPVSTHDSGVFELSEKIKNIDDNNNHQCWNPDTRSIDCSVSPDDNRHHCFGASSSPLCCPSGKSECYMCYYNSETSINSESSLYDYYHGGLEMNVSSCSNNQSCVQERSSVLDSYKCYKDGANIKNADLCCSDNIYSDYIQMNSSGAYSFKNVDDNPTKSTPVNAGNKKEGVQCTNTTVCVGGEKDGVFCNESENQCNGGVCEGSGYKELLADDDRYNEFIWTPPENQCADNKRDDGRLHFCAVVPQVKNLKVNGNVGDSENPVIINKNKFITFTFNTFIDDNQEPLIMYKVDWGDGDQTTINSVGLMDKTSVENPYVLYHFYSYWDLFYKVKTAKGDSNLDNIYCGEAGDKNAKNFNNSTEVLDLAPDSDYCLVKPKVQIRDNWSWCNGYFDSTGNFNVRKEGSTAKDCQLWQNFSDWIIIKKD